MKSEPIDGIEAAFGVLIVAYRRPSNVTKILEMSFKSGIRHFYIAIDAPRKRTELELLDHQEILNAISDFKSKNEVFILTRVVPENLGCAVSVLSACDWAFSYHENLIVLEDDCIPTETFFYFCQKQLPNLVLNPKSFLICGSQFAPSNIVMGHTLLSRFALTWGWATNRDKWNQFRSIFCESPVKATLRDLISLRPESCFWNAGRRRALSGISDVWDTVLVSYLISSHGNAILPPVNLVSNVGNDSIATHTRDDTRWTNFHAHELLNSNFSDPEKVPEVESWLSRKCFGIRFRHIISTKITLLLDLIHVKPRKFQRSLAFRLNKVETIA